MTAAKKIPAGKPGRRHRVALAEEPRRNGVAPTNRKRGILFSGPMVRAILEGRKSQTRRVVNPRLLPRAHSPFVGGDGLWRWMTGAISYVEDERRCPHGQPGDRLWVRETWGVLYPQHKGDADEPVFYRADYTQDEMDGQVMPRWRPSIFMPRWASRITLDLTEVRVERLQDISEEDARAEGCQMRIQPMPKNAVCMDGVRRPVLVSARGAFRELWESINPPPQCSYVGKCNSSRCPLHSPDKSQRKDWDANPWVWALTVRRVE